MAITITAAVSGRYAQDVSSSTSTPAWTPNANKLSLLTVFNTLAGTPNTPTVSASTTGLNWVQCATGLKTSARCTVFRAMKPSGLSNGTVTVDFAGQTNAIAYFRVDEFDGVDTSGTDGSGAVRQPTGAGSASDTSTSMTITLGAFGSANNGTFFACHWRLGAAGSSATPTSGFTELNDAATSNVSIFDLIHTCWRADNSTDCTSTLDTQNGQGGMVALELVAGGGTFDPGSSTIWMPQAPMERPAIVRMVASGTVSTTRLP